MKMNVTDMFTGSADLSGLFGKKGLSVSQAFHQAVIEVKPPNFDIRTVKSL